MNFNSLILLIVNLYFTNENTANQIQQLNSFLEIIINTDKSTGI
jgi:hypothetical protein